MLFNSYPFLFLFLPLTLVGYLFLLRKGWIASSIWFLALASLLFYGCWKPVYLLLLLLSIAVNFSLSHGLMRLSDQKARWQRRLLLIVGIVFNLGLLAYFKYAHFVVSNLNLLTDSTWQIESIILPLAISFFTFQQIAFLVDIANREIKHIQFSHYLLFVTFFPQLIAGPIVHHKEMMPQFATNHAKGTFSPQLLEGAIIFFIGLFKKTVLADGIAVYASPVFAQADAGEAVSLFVAWGGALAYTLQLYFDFSGYSDMAIGIARLFGISLPLNFNSPYKATSIIDFWRRWHITLSRFLRDYVYIPLGGSHFGRWRRYQNLLFTMLLGGLWHGAGWNFIIWGALHGGFLVINHGWLYLKTQCRLTWLDQRRGWQCCMWLLTFFCVVNAWVFFRAPDLASALVMLEGMYGFNGIAIPNAIYARLDALQPLFTQFNIGTFLGGGSQFIATYGWIVCLLPIALFMPNTYQLTAHLRSLNAENSKPYPVSPSRWYITLSTPWLVACSAITSLAIFGMASVSEFLYFQF
uniref:MBOAT family O-acyltransferase n=1 Tax=Thaumasiovibrio occultus TaxID=1891184 RepID=UPI000B356F7F|nr:MBOAT family O-acyltransferase [Thaumasiovibrio occultus]